MQCSTVRPLVIAMALAALPAAACATGNSADVEPDPAAPAETIPHPPTAAPTGPSARGTPSWDDWGPTLPNDPPVTPTPPYLRPRPSETFLEPDAAVAYDAAPRGFTQAEMQSFVNHKCAPCHVGLAQGGLSLSGNFKTATVNVASTELHSMKRINPGARATSYLYLKIAGTHLLAGGSGARMPTSGPPFVSELEIELVGQYIDSL